MLTALKIMLLAMGISVVTGFMISLLIRILCRLVRLRAEPGTDDDAQIALAIAAALVNKTKQ